MGSNLWKKKKVATDLRGGGEGKLNRKCMHLKIDLII